jgi:transcriptional regulator NrdR family protein
MEYAKDKKAARACPACGADSHVYDSREQEDGRIMRRRRCVQCGAKFITIEQRISIFQQKNFSQHNM